MIITRTHKILFWVAICLYLILALPQLIREAARPLASDLVINELMASNGKGPVDEDGDYSDWIEIYNPTRHALNLAGWSLTDDPAQPEKWRFPDMPLSSGEYLIVFASGKNRYATGAGAELHTNFKLDKETGYVALYNIFDQQLFAVNEEQDSLQFRDVSYGLYNDEGEYGYLLLPTPGQPNNASVVWQGVVPVVMVSAERGFYEQPFQLSLSTTLPDASIFYTTDGSAPSAASGLPYTAPIPIQKTTLLRAIAVKPDFKPSPISTHTYLFLSDILQQPAQPPGFPESWGTYAETRRDFQLGAPAPADYEMDPEIVNGAYRAKLIEGLQSIPSISIVIAMDNLDIYAYPRERGAAWERPVSVELIDPSGVQPGFQTDAGIRIQGAFGRHEFMPKHSFRLFFRDDYGPTKLEYPLFADSPVTEFNTLILRGGVNRSYAGYIEREAVRDDHRLATYTRDEWLRASQIAMTGVGSHGTFVHLYLNGLYWGLYNLVERPDAAFADAYLGGEKEDWYAHNQSGPISGVSSRFDTLHELVGQGADTFLDPDNYAEIEKYLDVTNFIDYVILNFYAGNQDWAANNWYAVVRNPGGQTRYFAWDNELIWEDGASLDLGPDEESKDGQPQPNRIKTLFWALMWNVDFKMAFADRVYHHLFNDGALSEANAKARWQEINDSIDPTIVAESARWGDARYSDPITYDDWLAARADVLAQMAGNSEKLVVILQEKGLYPTLEPPTFSQRGGLLTLDTAIELSSSQGQIYYTTDGTDPRLKGSGALPPSEVIYWTGVVAPNAQPYDGPLVLTASTQIKTRVLADGLWSPLTSATFKVVDQDPGLRLTELMYNPVGGGAYEFVELENTGSAPLNLAGAQFEGIDFTFPADMSPVLPGARVVLARNEAAFRERYPQVSLNGTYGGQFSNAGEAIRLLDNQGNLLFSVAYDDENGWPISPDGRGDSLVLINPDGNPDDPQNWRASQDLFGSPGRREF